MEGHDDDGPEHHPGGPDAGRGGTRRGFSGAAGGPERVPGLGRRRVGYVPVGDGVEPDDVALRYRRLPVVVQGWAGVPRGGDDVPA